MKAFISVTFINDRPFRLELAPRLWALPGGIVAFQLQTHFPVLSFTILSMLCNGSWASSAKLCPAPDFQASTGTNLAQIF